MSLEEYRSSLTQPLRPRTVTFLIDGNRVLVGLKMRGFGEGKYLGIGGKVEEGKDRVSKEESSQDVIKNGALREILEEVSVTVSPEDLQPMGVLRFYFPHVSDESWNQEVYIFTANKWKGSPVAKTDSQDQVEINPKWFLKSEIPLKLMWDDAQYWLPQVLTGKSVRGDFLFNEDLKVIEHQIF